MIKHRHRLPLFCLLLTTMFVVPAAAQNSRDCLQMVRAIYKQVNNLAGGDRSCSAVYTVRTTVRTGSGDRVTSSQFTLVANGNRMQLTSREIEIFQDASSSITILPANRTIYLTDTDLPGMKEKRRQSFGVLQDSLLSTSQVIECSELRGGGSDRRIVLRLNNYAQRNLQLATVAFELNSREGTLQKITLTATPESRTARVEIAFEKIDLDYRGPGSQATARSMVYGDRGGLLPRYNGYTVYDSRATARRN